MTDIRHLIRTAVALAVGTAGLQAVQAQTLVSYDTFTAATINPARWFGEEGKQYGGTRTETHRSVVAGQLRIEAKGFSDQFSNVGASTTRNALVFSKSSQINAMRATVTMRSSTITGCAANTTASAARARLFGFFFNAGYEVPGSQYNDVYAGIQLSRASNSVDADGVFRVVAFSGICTDDSCIGSNTLASQDMGTVTTGTAIALQVYWDAANNRFTYQRDAETPINLAYTVADTLAPSYPGKRMEISNQIAHCTASRPSVNAMADFDNVRTNALAATRIRPPESLVQQVPAPVFDEAIGRVD